MCIRDSKYSDIQIDGKQEYVLDTSNNNLQKETIKNSHGQEEEKKENSNSKETQEEEKKQEHSKKNTQKLVSKFQNNQNNTNTKIVTPGLSTKSLPGSSNSF